MYHLIPKKEQVGKASSGVSPRPFLISRKERLANLILLYEKNPLILILF